MPDEIRQFITLIVILATAAIATWCSKTVRDFLFPLDDEKPPAETEV